MNSEKYPRGRRGSPAKGVVRENRSEGSNPSFSAIDDLHFLQIIFFLQNIVFLLLRHKKAPSRVLFFGSTHEFNGFEPP